MNKDVECPYCEKWNEVCHDDGFGYEEDVAHEMECYHCEKNFVFHTSIIYHYTEKKADCLNGSPHDFTDWRKKCYAHEGKEWQGRYCRDCEKSEERVIDAATASRPETEPTENQSATIEGIGAS